MRVPEALEPLVDQGVIDEVIRPLMAGKEAQIFLVSAAGVVCVAKVYKDAADRSFKHRADYLEGRRTRNSRSDRAMQKRSRFGREQIEAAWRSAEVDAIYKLRAAGVRVPEPFTFVDGVLLMELVMDGAGEPAPRLADVDLTEEEARWVFNRLLGDVTRMLCAGIVHGDLSDFNVLIAWDGPVIIDFPQAVDAAHNNSAGRLLIRDVDNLTSFFTRWLPELRGLKFGQEMWSLYEQGQLRPDSVLTGRFEGSKRKADTNALLREIDDLEREARARRESLGLAPARPARTPVVRDAPAPRPAEPRPPRGGRGRPDGRRGAEPTRKEERPARTPEPRRGEGRREVPEGPDDLDLFLVEG